jgi:hypothetical protein
VTTAATGAVSGAHPFANVATELGPLLNRVVFFGIATCRDQFDSVTQVRAPAVPTADFHAISTTSIDRFSGDLTSAGWKRLSRSNEMERWLSAGGILLCLETASSEAGDSPEVVMLEYASLITRAVQIGPDLSIRVSAVAAQVPLHWRLHARSGLAFSASPWVEDLIEIVVRRTGIIDEIALLPDELRTMVAQSADAFSASEAALWTIERALPDARTTPGFAAQALERFRAIGALRPAAAA